MSVSLAISYCSGEVVSTEEAYYGAGREASPTRSEEACVGARVRVRSGYRKSELWGALGTISKVWGAPHYAVVEVQLDGGGSELLWRHELEEIREEAHQGLFARLSWG
jgi:hypothetical protein